MRVLGISFTGSCCRRPLSAGSSHRVAVRKDRPQVSRNPSAPRATILQPCAIISPPCPATAQGCPTMFRSCATIAHACQMIFQACATILQACWVAAHACRTIPQAYGIIPQACKTIPQACRIVPQACRTVPQAHAIVANRSKSISCPVMVKKRHFPMLAGLTGRSGRRRNAAPTQFLSTPNPQHINKSWLKTTTSPRTMPVA